MLRVANEVHGPPCSFPRNGDAGEVRNLSYLTGCLPKLRICLNVHLWVVFAVHLSGTGIILEITKNGFPQVFEKMLIVISSMKLIPCAHAVSC